MGRDSNPRCGLSRTAVFKTAAFDHSATHPASREHSLPPECCQEDAGRSARPTPCLSISNQPSAVDAGSIGSRPAPWQHRGRTKAINHATQRSCCDNPEAFPGQRVDGWAIGEARNRSIHKLPVSQSPHTAACWRIFHAAAWNLSASTGAGGTFIPRRSGFPWLDIDDVCTARHKVRRRSMAEGASPLYDLSAAEVARKRLTSSGLP